MSLAIYDKGVFVFMEGRKDWVQESTTITIQEEMSRSIQFSKGCRKICDEFGLSAEILDVDGLLAPELICDNFKEVEDDGIENNC